MDPLHALPVPDSRERRRSNVTQRYSYKGYDTFWYPLVASHGSAGGVPDQRTPDINVQAPVYRSSPDFTFGETELLEVLRAQRPLFLMIQEELVELRWWHGGGRKHGVYLTAMMNLVLKEM